jgi:DNA processing protein
MKKLTLSTLLSTKIDRLNKKVSTLHYIGTDPSLFDSQPIVAIVGTRKPTPYGKAVTEQLADGLARAGITIVSGNAMGVDAIAQKSALQAGGRVISVIPSGLDVIYPATNRTLAKNICDGGGAVISEFGLGHTPTRYDFLHRNRIIAALSDIVLIPEAAEKSGSLNTAKHAFDMNIPLAAVPGPITSTMSSGTNALLKDGAKVVRAIEDVLEILGVTRAKQTSMNLEGNSAAETAVLHAINNGIFDIHEIQTETKLSTADFQMAVTMLEVAGRIKTADVGTLRII